jgi:hypothetical protein
METRLREKVTPDPIVMVCGASSPLAEHYNLFRSEDRYSNTSVAEIRTGTILVRRMDGFRSGRNPSELVRQSQAGGS